MHARFRTLYFSSLVLETRQKREDGREAEAPAAPRTVDRGAPATRARLARADCREGHPSQLRAARQIQAGAAPAAGGCDPRSGAGDDPAAASRRGADGRAAPTAAREARAARRARAPRV